MKKTFILMLFILNNSYGKDLTPLDIMPGNWSIFSTDSKVLAQQAKLQAILKTMTPEQKKALNHSMKGNKANLNMFNMGKVHACFTKEDIKNNKFDLEKNNKDKCKTSIQESSSKKLVVNRTCPGQENQNSQTIIEVKSQKEMLFTVTMNQMSNQMKATWTSANCK